MTKRMLPETPIRKVEMRYRNNNANNLEGLRLFDEKNTMIFELGKFDSNMFKVTEIAEDERIIGFWSRGSDGGAYAFDFQLMIAKLT